MEWAVEFVPAFASEFDAFPQEIQDPILASVILLEREGHDREGPTPIPSKVRSTRE